MEKLSVSRILTMFMMGCILSVISCQTANHERATDIFNGLSDNGKYPGMPYLTAGDKSYIVGFQDGSFPDIGNHVEGEMGGFWTPPLKLLDTSKGWFTNKNWVISTPAEVGIAPRGKAIRLLDKVRKEDCGPYGPYLSAVEGKYMMTIATGVQAMAEAKYGRTDEALWYADKIAETFGMALPGSISEMMPDYGCPVQGWTIYGLACPLVTHIFGIQPDAYNKSIIIEPHLPMNWEKMAISRLPVGNNNISLSILKSKSSIEYDLTAEMQDWSYVFPVKEYSGNEIFVNGEKVKNQPDEILVKGKKNRILLRRSVK